MSIHTVQPGETVFSIASLYKISVEDLLLYNGLTGSRSESADFTARRDLYSAVGYEFVGSGGRGGTERAGAFTQ